MENNMVHIDGSVLEGGGQILRMAVAFSVLLQTPIKISRIRLSRQKPGLTPQHHKGIEIVCEMTGGKAFGAEERSTELTFYPGHVKGGEYLAAIRTAGSISLLTQLLLPCALFASGETVIDLRGGTNCEMAPHIDYTATVLLRLLAKFGAIFDYKIDRRGFFPKGGGRVILHTKPVKILNAVDLSDPGKLSRIWGTVFTAGNYNSHNGENIKKGAMDVFRKTFPEVRSDIKVVEEDPNKTIGSACGISVFGETTSGCVFGHSELGHRNVHPNKTGADVASVLCGDIWIGGCVDEYLQDQAIIYMALANGVSKILSGPITLHTETAIYVAERMTKAKFTISDHPSGVKLIQCTGIGLINKNI
uniref:RNA 3'-terminal phosphate cyclase n=1 Tax=Clastoptera arizonana TaxID=38151 RepID=A0A1B6EDJ6_9HEMI